MVRTYESLIDQHGNWTSGLTKLFIISTLSDGSISRFESGASVPSEGCVLFIVDVWLINQIDKIKYTDGVLKVKDGETLDEPQKSEADLQEEALLRQLAELRAKKDEGATE